MTKSLLSKKFIKAQIELLPTREVYQAYLNNKMFQICLKKELEKGKSPLILDRVKGDPNSFSDRDVWHKLIKEWPSIEKLEKELVLVLNTMRKELIESCLKNEAFDAPNNRLYLDFYREVYIKLNPNEYITS